ncbi:hypothetical protein A0H81_03792 [Grifola frondosa]|uniref:Uncharacterized protein n=1 Tax=Grifola frondosa TaxID=5627 RepID=A0A1C7MJD3_GRIFR|nr:hypothetical protein A0H81_03792 [Grifola frondosa]
MYETSGYPTLPVFVPAQSQQNPIKPYNDQALAYAGYIPNPYDQAYAGIEMPVPPDAAAEKPFQRRRSTHRKQPPSYPELNIIVPNRPVYSSPSPLSAISLSNSPLKPSSGVNPANPIEQPVPSPASGDRSARRSLTKPISPVTERAAKRTSARSHVHELDPFAPQMPVSLPLPDAFGGSVTDEKAPMRRFMVRNE